MTFSEHKKKHQESIRVCPKCGNKEGVMSVLNFYFCPVCDKKEKKKRKDLVETNGGTHE